MDRLRRCDNQPIDYDSGESFVIGQSNITIYEGGSRTCYERGSLHLTNFRLIWLDSGISNECSFCLPLVAIREFTIDKSSWGSTTKLVLTIDTDEVVKANLQVLYGAPKWAAAWLNPSLEATSKIFREYKTDTLKFGFVGGSGYREFQQSLQECMTAKCWETQKINESKSGILGIQRVRVSQINSTDKDIGMAFEDLDKLMTHAAEMVKISKELNKTINDKLPKDADNVSDEIIAWRNELLMMGIEIDSPSINSQADENSFSRKLAREICQLLLPLMELKNKQSEGDGSLDLATAFCRVNRARGLDLISPNDMLSACKEMERMKLPIVLKVFSSSVKILELASENTEKRCKQISDLVTKHESLSISDLAKLTKISTALAKERLLTSESKGFLCRDDSTQGFRFYPNKFLYG